MQAHFALCTISDHLDNFKISLKFMLIFLHVKRWNDDEIKRLIVNDPLKTVSFLRNSFVLNSVSLLLMIHAYVAGITYFSERSFLKLIYNSKQQSLFNDRLSIHHVPESCDSQLRVHLTSYHQITLRNTAGNSCISTILYRLI